MALPTKDDLLGFDYSHCGLPFIAVHVGSTSLLGFDYSHNGLPFIGPDAAVPAASSIPVFMHHYKQQWGN